MILWHDAVLGNVVIAKLFPFGSAPFSSLRLRGETFGLKELNGFSFRFLISHSSLQGHDRTIAQYKENTSVWSAAFLHRGSRANFRFKTLRWFEPFNWKLKMNSVFVLVKLSVQMFFLFFLWWEQGLCHNHWIVSLTQREPVANSTHSESDTTTGSAWIQNMLIIDIRTGTSIPAWDKLNLVQVKSPTSIFSTFWALSGTDPRPLPKPSVL